MNVPDCSDMKESLHLENWLWKGTQPWTKRTLENL